MMVYVVFGVTIAAGSISEFFFFSSRRRHTRYIGDWSSDVCSSDLKQMVVMAQDSANTLMAVINDVLDFSKIEAGKLAFDVREFELSDAVAEAARNMALRAHQKGLELAYQIGRASCRERT